MEKEPTRILPANTPRENKWLDAVGKLEVFDTLVIPAELRKLIKPYSSVLDGGCGKGTISRDFTLNHHAIVYGIDIDKQAIRLAKIKNSELPDDTDMLQPEYMWMNCTQTSFPSDRFDLVNLKEILGLGEPERREEVLVEMVRVLKPGAILAVTDHARDPRRKDQYEKAQAMGYEYGTFPVFDANGKYLFDATHFSTDNKAVNGIAARSNIVQLLVNAGIERSSIRVIVQETTGVAVEGTAPKTRVQVAAYGFKPEPYSREIKSTEQPRPVDPWTDNQGNKHIKDYFSEVAQEHGITNPYESDHGSHSK